MEPFDQFESRKGDHLKLSLDPKNEALGQSGFSQVRLDHEAFPELNFTDINLQTQVFGHPLSTPLFVSSMTAGHTGSLSINRTLIEACAHRGWAMGVGSQRRELFDENARQEWKSLRREFPKAVLFSNIGLSQLIETPLDKIRELAESLSASAMIVHTNPLQECLQPEGTPRFRGGLSAVAALVKHLSIPIVVKETGCGFSPQTLARLNEIGLAAVDVGGFGGTHWGRIEGDRSAVGQKLNEAALTFSDWGISTVDSLLNAIEVKPKYEIWASGGIRSGLDAAKAIAIGASMVGLAKPILEVALKGPVKLDEKMETLEYELKMALFCTGSKDLTKLKEKRAWRRQTP